MKVLFFFLFRLTFADPTCSPEKSYGQADKKNVINDLLGPVRDQDSVGFCYAYAAADLIEYSLKRKGVLAKDQQVSGLALSIQYHEKDWKDKALDFKNNLPLIKDRHLKVKEKEEVVLEKTNEISVLQDHILKRQEDFSKPFFDKKTDKKEISDEEFALKEKEYQKMINSPELVSQIIPLEEKIITLKKEIEQLKEEIQQLNQEITHILKVKEGGRVDFLMNEKDRLFCTHDEINDRDIGLAHLFSLSSSLKDIPRELQNINGALSLLNLSRELPEEFHCPLGQLYQHFFPKLSSSKEEQFVAQLAKISADESVLNFFLKKSCINKMPSFRFKSEGIDRYNMISKKNDSLFTFIDEQLKFKRPVGINYHSEILKKENNNPQNRDDNHTSILTGKVMICGEDYYILRNSWGQSLVFITVKSLSTKKKKSKKLKN
jgi:hypothetical protein